MLNKFMKAKQLTLNVFKLIFIDLIWEIIYFPIWWYSSGLYRMAVFCLKKIKRGWYNLGLNIHFKFLFKPMYAQRDFAGRAISFFARLFTLIFKLIVFFVFLIIILLLFLLWLTLPIIIIWQIYLNSKFLS